MHTHTHAQSTHSHTLAYTHTHSHIHSLTLFASSSFSLPNYQTEERGNSLTFIQLQSHLLPFRSHAIVQVSLASFSFFLFLTFFLSFSHSFSHPSSFKTFLTFTLIYSLTRILTIFLSFSFNRVNILWLCRQSISLQSKVFFSQQKKTTPPRRKNKILEKKLIQHVSFLSKKQKNNRSSCCPRWYLLTRGVFGFKRRKIEFEVFFRIWFLDDLPKKVFLSVCVKIETSCLKQSVMTNLQRSMPGRRYPISQEQEQLLQLANRVD